MGDKDCAAYGSQKRNPWQDHIVNLTNIANENRFFPDPTLGPPKTPLPGLATLPSNARMARRDTLDADATAPCHQMYAVNGLGKGGRTNCEPPFATCPTHRTGATSLGTPWDGSQAPTARSGRSTMISGATGYTGLSGVSKLSKRSRRSNRSWRSASSLGLINQIQESNDMLRGELKDLKSMVQGTNQRLSAMDQHLEHSARHSRRHSQAGLTSIALQSHELRSSKHRPLVDSDRTKLSRDLSHAKGGFERRQALQKRSPRTRGTHYEDRVAGGDVKLAGANRARDVAYDATH